MSLAGYAVIALATAVEVTADGPGTATNVSNFSGECRLVLNSAAGAASTTLNVKIQHSADGLTGWTDTGVAFAQVATEESTQSIGVSIDRFKKFIRVVDDVAGTTPSFVRAVFLIAKADNSDNAGAEQFTP